MTRVFRAALGGRLKRSGQAATAVTTLTGFDTE
jgi:hypothetical protein